MISDMASWSPPTYYSQRTRSMGPVLLPSESVVPRPVVTFETPRHEVTIATPALPVIRPPSAVTGQPLCRAEDHRAGGQPKENGSGSRRRKHTKAMRLNA